MGVASDGDFGDFVRVVEPRLRRALIAKYGLERGREATAEALAYAWEHWSDVQAMSNAAGYLYRVGQSRTRRRRRRMLFARSEEHDRPYEPRLPSAVAELSDRQRLAVVLVHGFSWTLQEVADLTGQSVSTVQTHLERGMAKLRAALGDNDATA